MIGKGGGGGGEAYSYPEGCLGISGFGYCLWGPFFIHVNHRLYYKLFWSGATYFGKQDSIYISSLDFSIHQSLVHTLESGIILRLLIVRIVQE